MILAFVIKMKVLNTCIIGLRKSEGQGKNKLLVHMDCQREFNLLNVDLQNYSVKLEILYLFTHFIIRLFKLLNL